LRAWAGTGLKEPKRQKILKVPKGLCCTDILALNRAALNEGVCTASELRDYRNTHCLVFSRYARREGERLPPLKADKDHVYGTKTNYITSMQELLSDQELKDWQQCIRRCMKEKMVVKKLHKPDPWKENTACILRASHSVKSPKTESLWKLPKFENKAKPHICTFRSETALTAAHKANVLEKVGRQGIFGEGIRTIPETTIEKVYPMKN
ncbi:cilia- and flagella-associated protein 77, partial [Elysia marginata]